MNRFTTLAAMLMFISAMLHLSAPMLSGFVSASLPQLIFVVLYIVLGLLVLKNKRWAMWLGFFLVLFGGIAGMAGYLGASVIPDWASLGIWVVNWVAAVCLFLVLWRDHVPITISKAKD